MLRNYHNAAILRVRELRNGVDKLERLPSETTPEYLRRRELYIQRKTTKRK